MSTWLEQQEQAKNRSQLVVLGTEEMVKQANQLQIRGEEALRAVEILQTNGQRALYPDIQSGDTLLLDFFAGAGGATQGFVLAGFKPTYIVEAAPFKQQQYTFNIKNGVKIHERGTGDTKHFIYEKTAKVDADIMIDYMAKLVGSKRRIKYHVHASPSCVAFCKTKRSNAKKKKKDEKSLSNSLGTYKWTCAVIKRLKKEWGDSMTWSIEDAAELASDNTNRFNFPEIRSWLPKDHTIAVWDFTLWGVPQDRERTIILDGRLNIGSLPGKIEPNTDVNDDYLQNLINEFEEMDLTKSTDRKYGNKSMIGRIGMDKAFQLAGLDFPEGVVSMMSQASKSQVPSLIRAENKIRKNLYGQMNSKKNPPEFPEMKQLMEDYGETYYILTKYAYFDLLRFIKQECTKENLGYPKPNPKNMYPDSEIYKYLRKAHKWCKKLRERDIQSYVLAMIHALGQSDNESINKQRFAFATLPGPPPKANFDLGPFFKGSAYNSAHQNISLQGMVDSGKLTDRLKKKIQKAIKSSTMKKPTTLELRDKLGLRAARFYNRNIDTENRNYMYNTTTVTKVRPIWAPCFTIQAKSDKTWRRPIFKPNSSVSDHAKMWHTTQMDFCFMNVEQLKALGTFPLAYDFRYQEEDEKKLLEKVRYGIGDSVPPLVTLRLGLLIKEDEGISEEVMLHAVTNFKSNAGLMQTLFNDFKSFLSVVPNKKDPEKKLAPKTQQRYMREVYNHFAKHEFLGRGMLIKFKVEKKTTKTTKKKKINLKFDQAAAKQWIAFLQEKAKETNYFNKKLLKDHIRRHRLWTNEVNWIKTHRWAYPNQLRTERKTKEAADERQRVLDSIQNYDMTEKSKKELDAGFEVMLTILGYVFDPMTEVRDEMKNEEEESRTAEKKLMLIDLTGDSTEEEEEEEDDEDSEEDEEEEEDDDEVEFDTGEQQRVMLVDKDGYVDAEERKRVEKAIAARRKAEEKERQQYYDNLSREQKIIWEVQDFLDNFYGSQLDEVWEEHSDEAIRLIKKKVPTATDEEIDEEYEHQLAEKLEEYKKQSLGLRNRKRKIQLVAMIVAKEFPGRLKLRSEKKGAYTYSDKDVESRRKVLMNKTTMDGIDNELRKYDDLREEINENRIEWKEEEEENKESVATIFKRLKSSRARNKLKF